MTGAHGTTRDTGLMHRSRMRRERRQGNKRLLGNLCREIMTIAKGEYPHYGWIVSPSADGSTIEILLAQKGTSRMHGYVLHTDRIQDVTGRRGAIRYACGEILERFGFDRHRKTHVAEIVAPDRMNQRRELVMEGADGID